MVTGNIVLAALLLLLPLTMGQSFGTVCTEDADCTGVHADSICDLANEVTDPNDAAITFFVCACPANYIPGDVSADPAVGDCVFEGLFFVETCAADTDCSGHTDAICADKQIVTGGILRFCRCPDNLEASDLTNPNNADGVCIDPNPVVPVAGTSFGPCIIEEDCTADHADSICSSDVCICPENYFPFDTTGLLWAGDCVYEGTFFDTECVTATECVDAGHTDAICEVKQRQDALLFCRCRDNWEATDMSDPLFPAGECRFQAELEDRCDRDNTDCVAENSACLDDGYNQGTSRCMCQDGFVTFMDPDTGEYICGEILVSQDYPVCTSCEANEGICFATNNSDPINNYECKCPITQIDEGDNDCGKFLANVTCNIADFTMNVCYTPHPYANFSDGSAMYAEGYGDVEACKGVDISEDPEAAGCPADAERKLVLELSSEKKGQCGVREYRYSDRIVFEKTMVVTPSDSSDYGSDTYFDTFCSIVTSHSSGSDGSGFGGVGVIARPGNDQGEHLDPTLRFNVFNELGQEISEGVAIQLGDKLKFGIELTDDGTYSAAHVLACTASTSPKLPDDSAETQALLIDSCPAEGQEVFTIDNVWRMVSNQPNVLQTGLVTSFKFSKGREVFLHCRIKLCLRGSEAECSPVECDGGNSMGKRRRRQAEENEDVDITRRITYYDDDEEDSGKIEMDKAGFALLLSALLIILIVLAILVVLLFIKLRGRGSQVEDFGAPPNKQPQRFALPRIGNSAMRM